MQLSAAENFTRGAQRVHDSPEINSLLAEAGAQKLFNDMGERLPEILILPKLGWNTRFPERFCCPCYFSECRVLQSTRFHRHCALPAPQIAILHRQRPLKNWARLTMLRSSEPGKKTDVWFHEILEHLRALQTYQ